MPFEFQPYRSELTGTIAQIIGDSARVRGDALLRGADAQAHAALQRGQNTGRFLGTIGDLALGLGQQYQQHQADAPRRELEQLHLKDARTRDRTAQQEVELQRRLTARLSDQTKPPPDVHEIAGMGFGAERAASIANDFQEIDLADDARARDSLARRVRWVKALPEGMRQAPWASLRQELTEAGLPAEAIPEQYDDRLATAAIAWATGQEPKKPEPYTLNPGDVRFGPDNKPVANVPAEPPKKSFQSKEMLLNGKPTAVGFDPSANTYHYQGQDVTARVRPIPPQSASAGGDDVALQLTPEALDVVAHQFAMTGAMPPMGMGKAGAAMRTKIINRAAEIYKGLDVPTQQASFRANQESLKRLQAQADAIASFEETALKNLEVFLEQARKIKDSGSPLVNRPLRTFSERVLGSPEMAAYNAARRTVIPEFAKILANPGLGGVLSDSARHEVEELVPEGASLAQVLSVADILVRDAKNRKTATHDQIAAIRQRIATPPGQRSDSSSATVPAAVAAALKDLGDGRHTLSDGSVWVKQGGKITKGS